LEAFSQKALGDGTRKTGFGVSKKIERKERNQRDRQEKKMTSMGSGLEKVLCVRRLEED